MFKSRVIALNSTERHPRSKSPTSMLVPYCGSVCAWAQRLAVARSPRSQPRRPTSPGGDPKRNRDHEHDRGHGAIQCVAAEWESPSAETKMAMLRAIATSAVVHACRCEPVQAARVGMAVIAAAARQEADLHDGRHLLSNQEEIPGVLADERGEQAQHHQSPHPHRSSLIGGAATSQCQPGIDGGEWRAARTEFRSRLA